MGERDDREFEEALFRKHGYKIKPMAEDGNCLFRSVGASQLPRNAVEHQPTRVVSVIEMTRCLLCSSGVTAA